VNDTSSDSSSHKIDGWNAGIPTDVKQAFLENVIFPLKFPNRMSLYNRHSNIFGSPRYYMRMMTVIVFQGLRRASQNLLLSGPPGETYTIAYVSLYISMVSILDDD
jgi:SpoVK/Ycf46/Vps4 family AAA+-type ATPase